MSGEVGNVVDENSAGDPPAREGTQSDVAAFVRGVLALLSGGAAAVGFAMVFDYLSASFGYGLSLMVVAWAQTLWAVAVVRRPSWPLLVLGAAGSAVVLVGYWVSRAAGWPFGPDVGQVRPFGGLDILYAAFEILVVLGSLVLICGRSLGDRSISAFRARLGVIGLAAVVVLVSSAIFSMPGHEDATGADEETHNHDEMDMGMGRHEEMDHHDAGAGGPIVSVGDPRLTPGQAAAAQHLIDETRAGASGTLTTIAGAEAAGYQLTPSGNGPKMSADDAVAQVAAREKGGRGVYLHLFNPAYMHDGRELDPDRVESLVYQILPSGNVKLASAMYVLEPGKTADDAPDIAGDLTMWHSHMGASDPKLAKFVESLPPMIHVWFVDTPCGPFAAIGDENNLRNSNGCSVH